MIDIHSHILPMVDDGSQSIDESLRKLLNDNERLVTLLNKCKVEEENKKYNAVLEEEYDI